MKMKKLRMGRGGKPGIFLWISLLTVVSLSQAATIHWTGGAVSNDWNDAANWGVAYVPGATTSDSTLFVGTSDNTKLATPFSFANASSITVRADATLTFSADLSGVNQLYLGPNSGHNGGTVIHESGTVSAQTVKVGNSTTATSESQYTQSGGTLDISGQLYVNKGTFVVDGSSAAVSAASFALTSIGGLEFKLGASGGNPIVVANLFSMDGGSVLTIDASGYTGQEETIDLVQFGTISGVFDPSNIRIDGINGASIHYDGDSMNLVLLEHVATNVVISSSTNWSSVAIHPSDDVVVDPGVIVTMDADGEASSLLLNGTLLFELDAAGNSSLTLSNALTVGAGAIIEVDGADYEGGDGFFPVIVSSGLPSGLTDAVTMHGFDGRDTVPVMQDDDLWVQIVATTLSFSASADWSSVEVYSVDDVVVDSGVTVTVDTEGMADSVSLNGTLKFELDMLGDSSLTLNTLMFGAGWAIEVDGSRYEGMDLYFPIILASGLPTSLTNDVTFYGFGEREPALVVQDDGLWLRLIAPPSLSERLCLLVPESSVAVNYSNSAFSATRALKPTGSAWQPSFNEAHVMDTTLSQQVLASENHSWDLTVGRAGQIASFRVPTIGEIIPPQWQHKSWPGGSDRSPWIDEVWQGVAVRTPAADSWYIHQGGTYLFDPIQTEPFYSPQLAAELDPANHSFTTINWGQQAHTSIFTDDDTSNDYQSYVLYFTRVRDLGQGLIEVSLGFYNYGHDHVDHFNMPWGGIRLTNLREYFLSKPDGSWALATDGWDGDGDRYKDYDEAGGWVAFCNSTNATTPTLGLVYGLDPDPLLSNQTRKSYLWWKQTVTDYEGDETASRNYGVLGTIRKYTLNQGNGIWGRYYFVLGDDVADVATRIEERELLADESIAPFDYTESSSPLVGYSFSGSGSDFRVEENGHSPDFFLYAHPVTGSFPIYEIIENDKSRHLTWDPYATGVIKTYDGTIAGMRLLGFALPTADISGSSYTYESFDAVMSSAPGNYLPSGETLSVRTTTAQETWRIDHFGFADNTGESADTANPDADELNNLGEYAFGGDPANAMDIGYIPVAGSVTNGFEYIYARRTTPGHGLSYSLESNSNLLSNDWKIAEAVELPNPGTLDADFEAVTNRVDTSGKSNEFFRVKVDSSN